MNRTKTMSDQNDSDLIRHRSNVVSGHLDLPLGPEKSRVELAKTRCVLRRGRHGFRGSSGAHLSGPGSLGR